MRFMSDDLDDAPERAESKLIRVLRPLTPDFRNAALALIFGFGPRIVTQTGCDEEANKVWDMKFEPDMMKVLARLKTAIAINTQAINSMAENVYIKRNTLRSHHLHYVIFKSLIDKDKIDIEKDNYSNYCAVLETMGMVCDQHNSISELLSNSEEIHKGITSAIETIAKKHETTLPPSKWREVCFSFINNCNAILDNKYCSDDNEVVSSYLDDVFFSLVLPEPLLAKSDINLKPILEIYHTFKWLSEQDIMHEGIATTKTEPVPCLESIDPSAYSIIDTEAVYFGQEERSLEKQLEASLESISYSFSRLEMLTTLYRDIESGNTYSLEAINDFGINCENVDYALEGILDTIKSVIETLIARLNKAIPLIFIIIGGILSFMLGKQLSAKAHRTMNQTLKELKERVEEMHLLGRRLSGKKKATPNMLGMDQLALNRLGIEISLNFKTKLDELIVYQIEGYRWNDLMATADAHIKVIEEVMVEMGKTVELLKKAANSYGAEVPFNSTVAAIEQSYLFKDYYLSSHTKLPILDSVKQYGGKLPHPSDVLNKCTIPYRVIANRANAFWTNYAVDHNNRDLPFVSNDMPYSWFKRLDNLEPIHGFADKFSNVYFHSEEVEHSIKYAISQCKKAENKGRNLVHEIDGLSVITKAFIKQKQPDSIMNTEVMWPEHSAGIPYQMQEGTYNGTHVIKDLIIKNILSKQFSALSGTYQSMKDLMVIGKRLSEMQSAFLRYKSAEILFTREYLMKLRKYYTTK